MTNAKTCYYTDKTCPKCDKPIATNGTKEWCECMTDAKSKLEKAKEGHEQELREGGVDEWDAKREESSAIGQGGHSFGQGALWLLAELEKEIEGEEPGSASIYGMETLLFKARELCGK